jgi:ABC-type taurine transport system substrate-binding protein
MKKPATIRIDPRDIKCLAVRYHAFFDHASRPGEFDRAKFWAGMLDDVQQKTGVVLADADTLAIYLR